jgi:hypothetical protein
MTRIGNRADAAAAGGRSSRVSAQDAGWTDQPPTPLAHGAEFRPPRRLSWLRPAPLWESRNQALARVFGDPTNDHRRRWLDLLGRDESDDLLVGRFARLERISFIVMGDTGDGDVAQYSVAQALLAQAADTDFLFLCSDVVYPAGGLEEYGRKVLYPYHEYGHPIFAIPGNHDWYDDAEGFLYWFCGAKTRPLPARGTSPRQACLRRVWRHSPQGRTESLDEMAAWGAQPARVPGPYYAIEAGPLLLVGLDAGLGGPLDRRQGAWLRRISSEDPRPKILLTGKPMYANGRLDRRQIEGGGSVHAVVTDPAHGYLAVISADTHNYQRYLVTLEDGRQMPFIVSGGGGAFMHETHTIPNLDYARLAGVNEDAFRCYPLRGDSLARCSELWSDKLGPLVRGYAALDPEVAAAIAAERARGVPVRAAARAATPSARDRTVAELMYRLPGHPGALLHFPFSELLDWGMPPLFKHFLRLEATEDHVAIRCHAVTGRRGQEQTRLIEDELIAEPAGGGGPWVWTVGSRPGSNAAG